MRRAFQIVVLLCTLVVGAAALAVIVSQTAWFKDRLRGFIVRQADQYVNGDLSIGRLDGNLFFGIELEDVGVVMDGEPVIEVKDVGLDYSILQLISRGIEIDDIRLNRPVVHLRKDGDGWNLGRLIEKEAEEAERRGPGRPITIGEIGISDGSLIVDGTPVGTAGVQVPDRIERLDARIGFSYEPVNFTVDIGHVSFRGRSPEIGLNALSGKVAVREDTLYLDNVAVRTEESSVKIDGAVSNYLGTPSVDLKVSSDKLALSEIARVVPALRGIDLQPAVRIAAQGPADRLKVGLDLRSSAGEAHGDLVLDVTAPDRAAAGELNVRHLNVGPFVKAPERPTDITGRVGIDFKITQTAGGPLVRGTYRVDASRVAAVGYDARSVQARGRIDGPRISVTGRARAYGASATARGTITRREGAPPAIDLQGDARRVDLRNLPRHVNLPRVSSDLDLGYHVTGTAGSWNGDLRFRTSTIAGATLAEGTTANFVVAGKRAEYAARGQVSHLDLQRVGREFEIPALAADRYRTDINSAFDLRGEGTEPARLTLDATGALSDSAVFGGRIPGMRFETHLAGPELRVKAAGEFEGVDPALVSGRRTLAGEVTGILDVDLAMRDRREGLSPDSVTGGGRASLGPSRLGELAIDRAQVDAQYAARVGRIRELSVSGPDVEVKASGVLALDQSSSSNLTYQARSTRLERIGELIEQPLEGTAAIEGVVSGNARELRTKGTLAASNVGYRDVEALSLNSRYDVTVPDLDPKRALVKAETDAAFVEVAGRTLTELSAKTTYEEHRLEVDASAREGVRALDAAGSLLLHPDHQEVHVTNLSVRTEGIEWRTAPGSEAAVQYGRDRVVVENVRLVSGDQRIMADGTIGQAGGTLDVRAENVDLAQLDALLLDDPRLKGRLNASGRVTGPLEAPRVAGAFAIANGAFRKFAFQSFAGKVDYRQNGIELDARLEQNPQAWLTARGYLPMALFRPVEKQGVTRHEVPAPGQGMDFRVQSSPIDLGLVQGFTAELTEVTGTLRADLRVTGSPEDPHLSGFVDIKNGAFTVPMTRVAYTGLDTRVVFEPDVVKVEGLRLVDEHQKSLLVSGQLATHERQIGALNISVKSDGFELVDNELADIKVDTDLTITGELRRPRVEGLMAVDTAQVNVDAILDATDTSTYALAATEYGPKLVDTGGTAQPPVWKALALDVRVVVPNDMVLKGTDLRPRADSAIGVGAINVTVGGDLRARKDPGGTLRLAGVVNTVRGTYEFQGRRFDILRDGRIRFIGTEEINPSLDVTAERVIQGVEARVRITGTLKAPELTLSSRPPLDQADILSLIVFNQPVNQLGEGQQVSLAARAGALATGFVASPLAESISRALELDVFEIQTAPDNGGAATVTLGEQVGERLFLKFRQGFGAQSASEFLLEYQLADFLRLQTSIAEMSGAAYRTLLRRIERGGIDLIFFFSY